MITPLDIDIVRVTGTEYKRALGLAQKAEIGGRSQVRTRGARFASLAEDQLTGMLGHYAASVALYGSAEPYYAARAEANAAPYKGDGGEDLPGRVDVKASLIRNVSRRLSQYHMLVRPAELYDDHRYVRALVQMRSDQAIVRLMGWCRGSDMPREPNDEPGHPLQGAHVLPVTALLPLQMLTDQLRGEGLI